MTVREAVNAMFRHLRAEQRAIPFVEEGATYDNPLPDAIDAMNTALQQLAVYLPLFGAKQQRSAYFHAPATVAVTGLAEGGMAATSAAWPAWAPGCLVRLPGDAHVNRILSLSGNTATLQFPHLSETTAGDATVLCDCAELPADVISVLGPVRPRGSRHSLPAASGRESLAIPRGEGAEARYFVESAVVNRQVKLRLMLSAPVSAATVIEFQARTSLGTITADDVTAPGPGVPIPVPANFVESLFLPIATDLFFSKPCVTNYDVSSLRNEDAPKLIRQQAETARDMMERMRPQGRKSARVRAWW
ncbi:MAG TPA: hypothetical protein VGE39_20475 [Prosthecobacter sp.]